MKNVAKVLTTTAALALLFLASAYSSRNDRDFPWGISRPDFWNSPLAPFVAALLVSAVVFRFAFNHKSEP